MSRTELFIELSFVVLCKRVSSSLMEWGRLFSTLLSFMLPIAVLTLLMRCEVPGVCLSCMFASSGNTDLIVPGEDCLLHFPWWKIH